MVTKNNIQIWFKDFASNHTQIKEYGYGDFSDISMESSTTYPLMWVSPQPCSIEGNQISYSYTIAIADRCDKERNNAVEVESDTFQICLDILAGANDQANAIGWELAETSTLTPFFEKWKDEVEGHMVTVTLIVDFDYDKCSIPTISAVTPPSVGCADGQVNVNATFYNDVASGGSLNVVVKNVAGSLVGSLIGGEWIVPNAITCVDSTAVIKDSAGTTLKSQAIPSGATADITINDSTAIVKNSTNTTIASATDIKAEGSKNISVGDSSITVNSSAYGSTPATVAGNVIVKNTLGASVGSLITGEWIVPAGSSPSGVLLDLVEADQYTSYRTGDVGWRVQNGYFPQSVQPTNPKAIAELDYTSANYWYLLKNNLVVNGVSSKTRFVDVLGGQNFSATGNTDLVTLDKLTGNLIYRKETFVDSWNNNIDLALTLSYTINGVVYSDWYFAGYEEVLSFMGEFGISGSWVDPVTTKEIFNLSQYEVFTATTSAYTTSQCRSFNLQPTGRISTNYGKTNFYRPLYIHKGQNLITAP